MNELLPTIYLSGVVLLLGTLVFFVSIQTIRTTRTEKQFYKLQKKLQKEKGSAQEYYELGSLYLNKKLYIQATNLFNKGLEIGKNLEPENQALIYNALGFSYLSQEQIDLAIRNYKNAIKLHPQYIIALNNLANAYEKKQMIEKAVETYEQTLKSDLNNKIAKRRVKILSKRLATL
ncbi:tetratricopeptide repeat protein [Candidatus Atelocyanobacterium thalassae]|uniref:Tetratricopeptide repeat protein n=1 Tax=Atelocyanobacterium thalassa (isolate ALOHA) TaxID=1453429 RepID=D3EPJ9_ATETH|nr:tetratricopeptide repeat protein [Candidatus Atelocyanobacterium thalassa]ADB95399.1 tetratricopeptide repeat protein [Candidatus Atelocyanobacterium thalassa isolate ALOHA]MCH2543319.1 tetratricopeptide repeat protein [Candidatus Atelocyanobacterium sp. ALOHA_A2.5_9]|tara:strand:- start:738 stop:1265 length:528 start_codon:yes stop_codon:yes gene_type:complete